MFCSPIHTRDIYIYNNAYNSYNTYIGGWGGESVVKPPTGKSFRFVRACERARRGEAVWASERRFDPVARAVVRAVYLLLLLGPETMPGGLSTTNVDFNKVL